MVDEGTSQLDDLLGRISKCNKCREPGIANPLPHEPRPIIVASAKAKIAICGQAPGTRVHQSGVPFKDPSGDRLRDWLGVDETQFYDENKFAIIPMGFCFPGLDAKGSDLPPRKECAIEWRGQVMDSLPQLELLLIVGMHAQRWHLAKSRKKNMTQTVIAWREYLQMQNAKKMLPLPHPSWRNNAWIKNNIWFEEELLPELKRLVSALL